MRIFPSFIAFTSAGSEKTREVLILPETFCPKYELNASLLKSSCGHSTAKALVLKANIKERAIINKLKVFFITLLLRNLNLRN
jgi:hypothetical protein